MLPVHCYKNSVPKNVLDYLHVMHMLEYNNFCWWKFVNFKYNFLKFYLSQKIFLTVRRASRRPLSLIPTISRYSVYSGASSPLLDTYRLIVLCTEHWVCSLLLTVYHSSTPLFFLTVRTKTVYNTNIIIVKD